jgi:hypothetical protein
MWTQASWAGPANGVAAAMRTCNRPSATSAQRRDEYTAILGLLRMRETVGLLLPVAPRNFWLKCVHCL